MAHAAWMTARGAIRAHGRALITLAIALLTFASGAGVAGAPADASLGTQESLTAAYTYNAATGMSATLAAGRTPGVFGVTHSGAATYRVPLWTPPGVGELELDLALVYGSRSGNGTLGVGWSLAGLSAITRCNRTLAQDGIAGAVTNTTSDRFCLDGQQLKLVSGSYGVAGSVYATEIDSFARIVATGATGNGPAAFMVTSRNGLVYEYGGTTDSRIFAGNAATVRTWALSGVRDRAGVGTGNSISLTYFNDAQNGTYTNGTYRIASIAYPTTATGAGPFYQVNFAYSSRASSDVPNGYLAGNLVREPYKLDTITVQAIGNTEPIKTYNLTYTSAPTTGRLRLASVQECSASSCLRPTNFSYQDGSGGWSAMLDTGFAASNAQAPLALELNGDGLTDLLYPVNAGSGKVGWRIALATATGYAAPIDTGLVTSTSAKIIPGQFSGNARTQVLIPQNGYWYVAGYGSGGFAASSTGLAVGNEYAAADLDGDGLADLMSFSGISLAVSIVVRRNLTVPAAGVVSARFATATQTAWNSGRASIPADNTRVADLNGDGRADIVGLSFTGSERNRRFYATPVLSNGFGVPFTVGPDKQIVQESMVTMGDWNGDGCSDIIQVSSVYVSDCAGSLIEVRTGATPATGDTLYTAMPADWNGDGRTDLLYVDAATRQWWVVPSTGAGAGTPTSTGVAAPNGTAWFVHDADGDGLVDLGYRDGNNGNRLRYRLHASPGSPPDLAVSFTDGFGMQQSPSYASIARGLHTVQGDAAFPEADFQGALYVVSEFTASDGTGGTYRDQFWYSGARVHLQGRGFEGFQSQRISDSRSGLITYDYVQRSFPYTGLHTQRSVFQPDGATRVSQSTATVARQVTGGAGYEQRLFPYVASRTEQRHEYAGPLNGTLITETTSTYVYGDGYGNLTQAQSTVTDKDPYSPFFNSAWQASATFTYTNDASESWCLGLPASSVLTNAAPGQSAMTRTVAYTADTMSCRLTQQVIEPNDPALKVTTSYGFDGCGNLNRLSIIGANPNGSAMPARTSTLSYGTRCQLPESATNPLGQTTTFSYRYDFGRPAAMTDPNGLAVSWVYDDFGRRMLETRPDHTRTAWAYQSCSAGPCWGAADLRFLVYEDSLSADGAFVRERQRFYDGFERLRYDEHNRALGTWTNVSYAYDALGRATTISNPYAIASNGITARTYDLFDRLISERLVDGAGTVVRARMYGYAGRTVTQTDPLGRVRVQVLDAVGRLRRVVDPAPGGTTAYDYDSLGNLARIQDPIGAVSTGTWNVRGFRTQWSDADAGVWNFSGDSLGELTAWTDAKGQSFTSSYDLLGRLVSRGEPEGYSTWTWGSSATAKNIGRLQAKSGLGYAETYAYDSAGRLASRLIASTQNYQYDFTYNTLGKLDAVTYPVSPVPTGGTSGRYKIRYGYSYGWPTQLEDVTEGQAKLLWSLTSANDYGTPTSATLAGGAITSAAAFESATNLPSTRQAGVAGNPANRQNLRYQWDAAGNLLERRDLNQNLTEAFAVDGLDRLTSSTLNGVGNLTVGYNAAGNITQKSDVGPYTYGSAARPHAVTAAGTETYAYDANGNMVSRNSAAQQWSSFNLPVLLQKSGYSSQFAYGPDHQRWRQVATYPNGTETTIYVGSLLEKESATSTGLTYWRHYVPLPDGSTAVVSRNSNGSSSTSFVLTDHLGSSDTVLADTGSLRTRESFGGYGGRRGQDWNALTPPDWLGIANVTRQGFTAHEMLDNVGSVHMNGRVYDPTLGRFLSVDPLIGDVGDSQAVNPYAYVGNRPLTATDPSGLEFVPVPGGPCGGVCESVIASVIATVLGMDHRHALPPQPATALPGQSAQNGVGICGAGTFSPACNGMILYAGAPSSPSGGPETSTWAGSADDPYAQENLELFLRDLGINAIDVLILASYYDATSARDAAERGDYLEAVFFTGVTLCDVGKLCSGAKGPLKALSKATKASESLIPRELARVVAGQRKLTTLGRPGVDDVFVTAADDIAGMNPGQIAERLTIPKADKYTVIRFPAPSSGVAVPVYRSDPGFIPGGRTRGGAREYVIPNGPIPAGATIEVIE